MKDKGEGKPICFALMLSLIIFDTEKFIPNFAISIYLTWVEFTTQAFLWGPWPQDKIQ